MFLQERVQKGPAFVRALEPQSSEAGGGAWFLKAPVLAAPQLLDLSLGSSTAVSLLTLIVLHVASVLFQSGEIKVGLLHSYLDECSLLGMVVRFLKYFQLKLIFKNSTMPFRMVQQQEWCAESKQ